MFTPYNNLPNNSRVWIYQSDRKFTDKEVEFIENEAEEFITNWTGHGDDLKGSFTIKYNQFLILVVDENFNSVSGCSIDASVRFIQNLEEELSLDLMDKMNISFRDDEKINIAKLADFQALVKDGKITLETVVFNNMINTKQDLETKWEVPVSKSWHTRFFM
ncbi:ABC transporter ATPase [Tenacibaculum sp. UWU-22]|uniref:ABC transporter ATPase n=1 Tax=Tenacibaculum sp. UWU-22 TaxID=3234187 RepID=UPI0034DB5007